MKIDLIVISALLVILVILPFVLIPYLQNGGNKKLHKKFREQATWFNLNPDITQQWNLNLAGIDSVQKKFLLVQNLDHGFVVDFVDLQKIKSSKVVITYLPMLVNGKKEEVLQRIDLEFSHRFNEEKQLVNVYDYDLNYTQDLEVKNANSLQETIQKFLVSQPVLKRTA